MLKASRLYHCECCNAEINAGDNFYIVKGSFFKEDHPKKSENKMEGEKKKIIIVKRAI